MRNIINLSKVINFRGWGVIQFKKFLVLSMDVKSESSGHVSKLLGKLVTKCTEICQNKLKSQGFENKLSNGGGR